MALRQFLFHRTRIGLSSRFLHNAGRSSCKCHPPSSLTNSERSIPRSVCTSSLYGVSVEHRCLRTQSLGLTWRRYFGSCGGEEDRDVDTPEYVQIVSNHKEAANLRLIDVREPEELVESGQIPGAINIPLGEVESALSLEDDLFEKNYGVAKPSNDTSIIFHCRAGVRSLVALETANKLGYSRVRHYMRGYLGWQDYIERKGQEK